MELFKLHGKRKEGGAWNDLNTFDGTFVIDNGYIYGTMDSLYHSKHPKYHYLYGAASFDYRQFVILELAPYDDMLPLVYELDYDEGFFTWARWNPASREFYIEGNLDLTLQRFYVPNVHKGYKGFYLYNTEHTEANIVLTECEQVLREYRRFSKTDTSSLNGFLKNVMQKKKLMWNNRNVRLPASSIENEEKVSGSNA